MVSSGPIVGRTIAHYRIIEQIGAGGMGVVYRAHDQRLERDVALKVLPPGALTDESARKRFRDEALALSRLNHPNIATVFDFNNQEGIDFLVTELIAGTTLRDALAAGPRTDVEVVRLGIQLAEGLEAAHSAGVIHRDLKPGNLMLTPGGRLKILDFGLAKQIDPADQLTITRSSAEAHGLTGTLPYMAPEGLLAGAADARSDIWGAGCVMYEMAAGRVPFPGSGPTLIDAILHQQPAIPSKLNPKVAPGLEKIILKCLEKQPEKRYRCGADLRADLERLKQAASGPASRAAFLWNARVLVPLIVFTLAAVLGAAWLLHRNARMNWARADAILQATELMERSRYVEAFKLAQQAERYIPGDPRLQKLWPEISRTLTIHSTPEGADVYMREYTSKEDAWEYVGQTPIENRRVPWAFFRWRIEKPGYVKANLASGGKAGRPMMFPENRGGFNVELQKEGAVPPGMVFVKGGDFGLDIPGLDHLPPVRVGDYFIDKYEVTNRQFKEFVDAGGYTREQFWKQPFLQNGHTVPWKEAMAQFRDKTGRPGPATWMLGDYPEGQGDYPVSGVSWYEAAAYAEFAGKKLPTVYHWNHAAGTWGIAYIAPLSNFGGTGPVKVGATSGMGPFGTYDMAGNVKEWCWNEKASKRYILGGAWSEPTYMFTDQDAQDPFRRMPAYGFRLAKYDAENSAPMMGMISEPFRDYSRERPVSDQIFQIYKSLYAYDRKPLDAVTEPSDDGSDAYHRERVTFSAGYGNERVTSYVFLPNTGTPPYQTIIYFPGSDAIYQRVDDLQLWRFRYLVKSGRAVVYPIYKGTYSRGDELNNDVQNTTTTWRDHVIYWSKDLGRTIDYIESQKDLDHEKIAYLGFSWGAVQGALLPALEARIKTVILVGGGFEFQKTLPEVDPLNFAPRVKQPTLMINGRYDSFFPVESLQEPMFRLLGAPANQKRHLIFDSGHTPPNELLIKETLDWLDRYLGPVK